MIAMMVIKMVEPTGTIVIIPMEIALILVLIRRMNDGSNDSNNADDH